MVLLMDKKCVNHLRVKTTEIKDVVQEYHQHLASMGGLFYSGASTFFAFLAAAAAAVAVAADNATSRVACIQHGLTMREDASSVDRVCFLSHSFMIYGEIKELRKRNHPFSKYLKNLYQSFHWKSHHSSRKIKSKQP